MHTSIQIFKSSDSLQEMQVEPIESVKSVKPVKTVKNTRSILPQKTQEYVVEKNKTAEIANIDLEDHQQCKVASALAVLGGKWKLPIIKQLTQGTKRFNELARDLEGITQRMLTKQLRELEADLVVSRKVYPEIPPKVEYSLTQAGRDLQNVILELEKWGGDHIPHKDL